MGYGPLVSSNKRTTHFEVGHRYRYIGPIPLPFWNGAMVEMAMKRDPVICHAVAKTDPEWVKLGSLPLRHWGIPSFLGRNQYSRRKAIL